MTLRGTKRGSVVWDPATYDGDQDRDLTCTEHDAGWDVVHSGSPGLRIRYFGITRTIASMSLSFTDGAETGTASCMVNKR